MTDESNAESTFEFVEKKTEEFANTVAGIPNTVADAASSISMSVGGAVGNILSNIAPPSALPSFITNAVSLSQEAPKPESFQIKTQQSENVIDKQPSKDEDSRPSSGKPSPTKETTPTNSGAMSSAGGLFSWMRDTVANNSVLNKVAETAKSSVHSMITTLDPQMREFIYSGTGLNVIVASDDETTIDAVQEAFRNMFSSVRVSGVKAVTNLEAVQPVGFDAGVKAAQQRIASVRQIPEIPQDIPVIATENFLLELGEGKWYDLGVVILQDNKQDINLQTFTQMTPVSSEIVELAKKSTPANYSSCGLAVTIDSLMSSNLQVPADEWHYALIGVSRKEILFLAVQSLVGIYKNSINPVQ